MFHRGWFQVAVRSPLVREELRQLVTLYSTARLADMEGGGWPELGSANRYAGVIAELAPGFEGWCTRVREISPCLPVMVIAQQVDPCLLARLQARSIEVATLPLHAPQIVAFVQRSLAGAFLPSERVARMVAFVATSRGLTAREVQLLSYCLADEPRARVRRRLGISENTLKTQVKALLRKVGERNVDSLAKNVLRAALLAGSGRPLAEPIAPWFPALSGAA